MTPPSCVCGTGASQPIAASSLIFGGCKNSCYTLEPLRCRLMAFDNLRTDRVRRQQQVGKEQFRVISALRLKADIALNRVGVGFGP
jgi:hypothetical protein